jgi:hypothetical protein
VVEARNPQTAARCQPIKMQHFQLSFFEKPLALSISRKAMSRRKGED